MEGAKSKLSTFWIFATLNYLYCDVVTLMDRAKEFASGSVGAIHITQGFLLGAAVLVEIPISMVLLSRVLTYRANRLANVVAGITMTSVQLLTLVVTTPTPYYTFFSILEIACTVGIVWYAARWAGGEHAVPSLTKGSATHPVVAQ
ncbi:MAG TPA: DUF6326 family protein [Candidatus Sulfotelmatobacter sp.]|nr:DUF6326 family protein [Candidatus Sulfotelmatobacter sp.]